MELIISGVVIGITLILMVIMFFLGYREALIYKVDDPIKYESPVAGEIFDDEILKIYEKIEEELGKELDVEEKRVFYILIEEGYRGMTLYKKFMEEYHRLHQH
ncbi:MAG: hypothetical protein DSY66_03825 [Persephonella sp.]|nr:MAG: hypothetical protein DSY53_02725 [Persephonella sp.]RUM60761.1 MAG: hypothetical protein DSY66_03825 [Persephonella sp.]